MDLEALKKQALEIVAAEQDLLAQAFQEQQRRQGVEYGYFDALDAVIWAARGDPEKFMRDELPVLRELAGELLPVAELTL